MRAVAAIALIVASSVRAGEVAVALTGAHRFTIQEALAVDGLLRALADRHGAAYLVTTSGPWKEIAARLRECKSPDETAAVLEELQSKCGAERVLGLRWSDGEVVVFDTLGELGRVEADRLQAEPLQTQLLEICLGAPGSRTSQISAPSQPPSGQGTPEASTPGERASPKTTLPSTRPATEPLEQPGPQTPKLPQTLSGQLLYELAVQSYRQGSYSLALAQLTDAARQGADKAKVLELQAKVYGAMGDTDRQARVLRDLLLEDPGRTEAAVALALLLDQEGLWQEAVSVLEKAIERKPNEPQLYLRLGRIYLRQNRTKKALEVLSQGYEATADSTLAIELASARNASGDWQGAMAIYTRLASSDDRRLRARALDAMGDIYARLGMLTEAIEAYAEAARAGSGEQSLTGERYRRIYAAADALVDSHLENAWRAFRDVASAGGAHTREEALSALQAAIGEAERAYALCTGVLPPPELAKTHRQRKLYYALVKEALVAAATFIDTGREDMAKLAEKRLAEALQEKPAGEVR
ncbi:MAG: tetratricopeptide repeat protein [Armatimonadetes bacterium]|nr:tetratricopeptide repeat protein [Armatimonadota bacterium]